MNAAFALATLAMAVYCLFSAESIDASRIRSRQGQAAVPTSQKVESVATYVAITMLAGILAALPRSAASLLANSGKLFVTTILVAGTIAVLASKARADGIAYRGVAAFMRATGIFLLNLSIFYAANSTAWFA